MTPARRMIVFNSIFLAIKENFERKERNFPLETITKLAVAYGGHYNVTAEEVEPMLRDTIWRTALSVTADEEES